MPDARTYTPTRPRSILNKPVRAAGPAPETGAGVAGAAAVETHWEFEMFTSARLFVASAVISMSVLSSLAFAVPARADGPAMQPLHLVKECSTFTGKSGDYCTITQSDLAAIPVGSNIYYYGPLIATPVASTSIVLDARNGTTAIGYCNLDNPANTGTCSFWAGSGGLRGFQAVVTLTADANGSDYHWDGSYAFAQ
jgi:hypothetical protein